MKHLFYIKTDASIERWHSTEISFVVKAASREDAIRQVSHALIKQGYVKETPESLEKYATIVEVSFEHSYCVQVDSHDYDW